MYAAVSDWKQFDEESFEAARAEAHEHGLARKVAAVRAGDWSSCELPVRMCRPMRLLCSLFPD